MNRLLGARRAVVDVGLGQRRQAGADGRRHQHVDLGEHLGGERLEDRAAAAERLHVVGRRDGVAAIHPTADDARRSRRRARASSGRGSSPLRRARRCRHRRRRRPSAAGRCGCTVAPRSTSTSSARSIAATTGASAPSRKIGRHADAQRRADRRRAPPRSRAPARANWSDPAGRAPRSPQDAGAIARGAGERADIVVRERQRHHAVARHAGLRRLEAGDAAGRGGQPDRAAGVRAERHVVEARGDRRRPSPTTSRR